MKGNRMPKPTRVTRNDLKWGLLVMSWATGESQLGPGVRVPPRPNSIEKLKQICEDLGIVIEIPDTVTKIQFIEMKADTLMVRLPAKAVIEAFRGEIGASTAK